MIRRSVPLALGLALLVLSAACTNGSRVSAATPPTEITLTVIDRPALELLELLAKQSNCGVTADPSALTILATNVSITFDRTPWVSALTQIADQFKLNLTLDGHMLRATAIDRGHENPQLVQRYYDLSLLTAMTMDRRGFPLDLSNILSGDPPRGFLPPVEPERGPELNEFIEIIKASVTPQGWAKEGIAIEAYGGYVLITQTPAVHDQITRLIASLEGMAARQHVCRLYRLPQVPAGTNTVVTAKEWAAFSERLPPPAAVFIAHDDKDQRHFAGIQRELVIDVDQNQQLHSPVIQTVTTGLSLFVHPTATVTGVRVPAKLWATVDSTLPTTAVRDSTGQILVTITTPHITNDHADDLREIPPGGAAIYRFGERAYALTVEVMDYEPTGSNPKP